MKRTAVSNSRLQLRDEVEHLGLDGRVEPGRRLVEDQERGILGERHRDDDALLHAARELVRIALQHASPGRRSAPARGRRARARSASVRRAPRTVNTSATWLADPDRRVQRRARVLVDHRDRRSRGARAARSALSAGDVAAGDAIEPPRSRGRCAAGTHDRERRGRLAAAGLADEPVRLAALDREGDAAQDRRSRPRTRYATSRSRSSSAAARPSALTGRAPACRPSAIRLTPTISVAIASAGKSTVHQYEPARAGVVVGDLQRPVGRRRLHAEAQERQAGDGEDRVAEPHRRLDDDRAHDVRQDLRRT